MASKAVETAVEAYLAANWSTCPIVTENSQGEAPEGGSPFLLLQFPVASTERMPLGQRQYRESGGFRIVINVPRGGGTATIRDWGEQLAALFRDRNLGGVRTQVPDEPFTDNESDRGNYFQGAMVVPFTHDFIG